MSRSLRQWLSERRHRRGFGIHSPFGFFVVNEIIRAPYTYYAYHSIDLSLPDRGEGMSLGSMRRRARFLHRLVARLEPRAVVIDETISESFITAMMLADSRISIGKSDGKMLEVSRSRSACDTLRSGDGMLVVFDPVHEMEQKVESMMTDGLMLYSDKCILAIRRKGMAFTKHSCKF